MSGTNAWLKLRQSKKYEPRPFLLDLHGAVWSLPYALTLNHTVEEIYENCRGAKKNEKKLSDLVSKVRWRLFLTEDEASESFFLPQKMTLEFFIRQSEFVFIGLHGGIGEDGTLQRLLGRQKIIFNGSEEKASALCMDKY
ncbi:MAG: D-alanine-D-alanine ligase, partial [Candidatus Peregrinibacteria bacterium GW2011_GWE2_39_6]